MENAKSNSLNFGFCTAERGVGFRAKPHGQVMTAIADVTARQKSDQDFINRPIN